MKSLTISSGFTVSGTQTFTKTLTASSHATLTKLVTMSSAATVANTLSVTKTFTLSSGYKVPLAVGTTAANFPNYGVTTFGSTAAKSYTLATPAAGQDKWLYCTAATTAHVQKVFASASNAINFVSTVGSKNVIQFKNTGDIVHLMGASTTKWLVARVSAATYSTN